MKKKRSRQWDSNPGPPADQKEKSRPKLSRCFSMTYFYSNNVQFLQIASWSGPIKCFLGWKAKKDVYKWFANAIVALKTTICQLIWLPKSFEKNPKLFLRSFFFGSSSAKNHQNVFATVLQRLFMLLHFYYTMREIIVGPQNGTITRLERTLRLGLLAYHMICNVFLVSFVMAINANTVKFYHVLTLCPLSSNQLNMFY
jgi:hypothetical protein